MTGEQGSSAKTFVLVHGGGHGGWCWQRMASVLRNHGHHVWTPTLTGFGERHHLDHGQITFDTLVTDVAAVLEFEDLYDVVLVGLQTGGVSLAFRIAEILNETEGDEVPVGTLDVAFYRDDIGLRPVLPEAATHIPVDLTGKTVVLVDDVLFTGRTVRAALNALGEYGRAQVVELAVMVDRGHRELPIRPDYVGKNLPTRREEMVDVSDEGVWIGRLENR